MGEEEKAFSYCQSLNTINIPNSVNKIGEKAFYECTSLRNLVIPNNVTQIGENAFAGFQNSLTNNSLNHIEYHGIAEGAPWGAKSMN